MRSLRMPRNLGDRQLCERQVRLGSDPSRNTKGDGLAGLPRELELALRQLDPCLPGQDLEKALGRHDCHIEPAALRLILLPRDSRLGQRDARFALATQLEGPPQPQRRLG